MSRITQSDIAARINAVKTRLFLLDRATRGQLDAMRLRRSPVGAWYSLEIKSGTPSGQLHWIVGRDGMKAAEFYIYLAGILHALDLAMGIKNTPWPDDTPEFNTEVQHG